MLLAYAKIAPPELVPRERHLSKKRTPRSEERLPRDEWLAKALLGGKFDSYKKAPILPAKKGGWSLRQLGRFRVKREAS